MDIKIAHDGFQRRKRLLRPRQVDGDGNAVIVRQWKTGLPGGVAQPVNGQVARTNILIIAVLKFALKPPFPAVIDFDGIRHGAFVLILPVLHVKVIVEKIDPRQDRIFRDEPFAGVVLHPVKSAPGRCGQMLHLRVKEINGTLLHSSTSSQPYYNKCMSLEQATSLSIESINSSL